MSSVLVPLLSLLLLLLPGVVAVAALLPAQLLEGVVLA
jgi:hypothetical protein